MKLCFSSLYKYTPLYDSPRYSHISNKAIFKLLLIASSVCLLYVLFIFEREIHVSLVLHNNGSTRVSECVIPEWNQVYTDKIPNAALHNKWQGMGLGRHWYLNHKYPTPLAAFGYSDHIAVTTTAENHYGKEVWCRYFDCMLREIKSPFKSSVFPETIVMCGRRPGAVYIGVSRDESGLMKHSPVKIQYRREPQHFFTVCLATLYGDEPKWLQIVDFLEYYKLQGATFFHVYLRNVSDYDRLLLDDYVRTGEIEVIRMHDNFWRADFMWHTSQIRDCHFRSKHFSKWTAFLDIDERLEMKTPQFRRIHDYLRSITDPTIAELMFKVQWVQKTEDDPPRFINQSHLETNLIYRKFRLTSTKIGGVKLQPKVIIRPEMVAVMFVHYAIAKYPNAERNIIEEDIAVIRHYRSIKRRSFNNVALERINDHGPYVRTSIPRWIDKRLTYQIVKRIRYVYDTIDAPCGKKQFAYFRHGQVNAPCYLEMVKNGSALIGTPE